MSAENSFFDIWRFVLGLPVCNPEMLAVLVEFGADVLKPDFLGKLPLAEAIHYGHVECAKFLRSAMDLEVTPLQTIF